MMFDYIIKGDGMMALPVKSELNWTEFRELIRLQSMKIHPKGNDTIWYWGTIEFINPKAMCVDDFFNNAAIM